MDVLGSLLLVVMKVVVALGVLSLVGITVTYAGVVIGNCKNKVYKGFEGLASFVACIIFALVWLGLACWMVISLL